MTHVSAELSRWASTLDYWEQAALEMIVSGVAVTDSGLDRLLEYMLEDAGLANQSEVRPALTFSNKIGTHSVSPTAPVRLESISNLQNINALVGDQRLPFAPTLTVCYGGNGSGKSGYARVLGCAGFSRGDKDVLPDVTRSLDGARPLSADIEVSEGNVSRSIQYQIGSECPELGSFYVFDSTSVLVHLRAKNTLSFSPGGLGYLPMLAKLTDSVRARLQARVRPCLETQTFGAAFQGESEVTKTIAELGPRTDIQKLRTMAALAPTPEQTEGLEREIAQVTMRDVSKEIADLNQTIDDLQALVGQLTDAEARLGDQSIAEYRAALATRQNLEAAAKLASVDQFKSDGFNQIGSGAWQRFIEAAKALAVVEGRPEDPYPRAADRCLLCNQPLSSEARELLRRLWAFLDGEAQTKLDEASRVLSEKRASIEQTRLDFFGGQSVAYRHVQVHDDELATRVRHFVDVSQNRLPCALDADNDIVDGTVPELPDTGIVMIKRLMEQLDAKRVELVGKDCAQELADLQQQRVAQQHYALLGRLLPDIEAYVGRRSWAQKASGLRSTTRHITEKHNELLKELVTDRYVELFQQALRDLNRPLRVKIRTTGQKGQAFKQLVLETDPSALMDKVTPEKVLSEGEKRAVALADYLTEVALDDSSCGIILDDPVTSLDHEWKEMLAKRLVTEAKRRQVIIFTHDLPFLYLVRRTADEEGVDGRTHWVKRGDTDGKPGYVFADNCPALEQDYRKAKQARAIYERVAGVPPEEQEALLRQGFAALRTSYEAFIVFELLNQVVVRFDERLKPSNLKAIVWDRSVVDEVVSKFETLSRFIEGHLHSDGFPTSNRPTPQALLSEIQAFDDLRKRHKQLQKLA